MSRFRVACKPPQLCPTRSSPCAVTDPAFLVTRSMEDFVTWVDTSKIKRKVQRYNDKLVSALPPPPPPLRRASWLAATVREAA